MSIYRNMTFQGQDVELDGCEFYDCVITDCTVTFRGSEPFVVADTRMSGCRWQFADAAGLTLGSIKALAQSFGPEGGRAFIDMLFIE